MRHVLVVIFGSPRQWGSPACRSAWAALSLLSDGLCPLHGALNGLVYGLSLQVRPKRCWCAADADAADGDGGAWRAAELCRGVRRSWRDLVRRPPWRGRTSTDFSIDSEERHSMAAPLVERSEEIRPPTANARERQSSAAEAHDDV